MTQNLKSTQKYNTATGTTQCTFLLLKNQTLTLFSGNLGLTFSIILTSNTSKP